MIDIDLFSEVASVPPPSQQTGIDLLKQVFAEGKETVFFSKQTIYETVMEHYLQGKSKEQFSLFVYETWNKNKKLKLLDGSYLTSIGTYHPIVMFMNRNVEIVIASLEPDTWHTPEEEQDLPDFLRLEYFGVHGLEKVEAVEKKLNLKCKIKEYTCTGRA